jgi:hypothetical protein
MGANGSRECAPDDKLRDTHHNDGDGFREGLHPSYGLRIKTGDAAAKMKEAAN